MKNSIKNNFEGVLIKTLDDRFSYDPTTKTQWVKLKKNILSGGLPDSLDLVPIGAFIGKGKRQGVFGSFLLAAFNKTTNLYEPVCKLGSGFTEEMLDTISDKFKDQIIHNQPIEYAVGGEKPDIWIKPSQVIWF